MVLFSATVVYFLLTLTFVAQAPYMSQPYSQSRALWAITRASFKAIFANPSAIIFSILFPGILVLIFGAFGSGGGPSYRIALDKNSDTASMMYQSLLHNKSIQIIHIHSEDSLRRELIKGKLTAIVKIVSTRDSSGRPQDKVEVYSTTASSDRFGGFMQMLDYSRLKMEEGIGGKNAAMVTIAPPKVETVRAYRQIDFILPGQLGFSILFSTLFGVAFTFFNLREQLVLKRFYASPVKRVNILIGVGVSRLFFQMLSVIVLICFGYFFLNYTLVHGLATLLEILFMTIVMLFLLMGVGLIFSSIVKTDTSIPLLINLFGFPQMMLSGTFFPIEVFPEWMQTICKILPLTQYNTAIRKLSFEGLHLNDCLLELGILGAWILLVYIMVVRVLKWE